MPNVFQDFMKGLRVSDEALRNQLAQPMIPKEEVPQEIALEDTFLQEFLSRPAIGGSIGVQFPQFNPEDTKSFLERFADRPAISGELPIEPEVTIPVDTDNEVEKIYQPLLAQLSLPTPKFDLAIPGKTQASTQALSDAQAARDRIALSGRIGQAGELIGSGLAGIAGGTPTKPVATQLFEKQIESGQNLVKDLADRIDMEEKDPSSPQSQAFKQFAKKLGVDISGDFTASMGKQLLPFIYKGYQAEESRKTQKALLQSKMEAQKVLQKEKTEIKKTEQLEKDRVKMNEKFGTDIDSMRGRTGPFGKTAETLNRLQRLEGLIYNAVDGRLDTEEIKNLTKTEMVELAIGIATALGGGGAAARKTIEELTPDSLRAQIKTELSWLTNQPLGTDQQAFVERFSKLMNREKTINQLIINQAIADKAFTTHRLYKEKFPEDFYTTFSNKLKIPVEQIKEYEKTGKQTLLLPIEAPQTKPGMVKIRRKSDGKIKNITEAEAAKYLAVPESFERVE